MTHRLAGDDTIAFTLHRERDGNWPTDDGWAHRELAFANRLLQAYTDNTSLGFVRWDHELRIVEWSARAAAIFGWTYDEVRGRTFDELGLVYRADAARVAETGRTMQLGPATANVTENRNVTKDGRVLHCRWFSSRIPIDGSFQIVSLVDDVTATVEATASLEASEERFRSIFDYSPEPMLAMSPNGTIVRANDAAAREYGGSIDDLLGHPASDFLTSVAARRREPRVQIGGARHRRDARGAGAARARTARVGARDLHPDRVSRRDHRRAPRRARPHRRAPRRARGRGAERPAARALPRRRVGRLHAGAAHRVDDRCRAAGCWA